MAAAVISCLCTRVGAEHTQTHLPATSLTKALAVVRPDAEPSLALSPSTGSTGTTQLRGRLSHGSHHIHARSRCLGTTMCGATVSGGPSISHLCSRSQQLTQQIHEMSCTQPALDVRVESQRPQELHA